MSAPSGSRLARSASLKGPAAANSSASISRSVSARSLMVRCSPQGELSAKLTEGVEAHRSLRRRRNPLRLGALHRSTSPSTALRAGGGSEGAQISCLFALAGAEIDVGEGLQLAGLKHPLLD